MSPYTVLGVSPDADEATIKSAYRTLVKQFHPDRNPNDPNAEVRFREVQEAYEQITTRSPQPHTPNHSFTSIFETAVEVPIDIAFHGGKIPFSLNAQGRKFDLMIDIPAMSITGTRLKVNGLPSELDFLDLYIVVIVQDNPSFRTMGGTIIANVEVDVATAILGGEVSVKTFDGERFFQVQPCTHTGQMFCLPGLGFQVNTQQGPRREDFLVHLSVVLPSAINDHQRAAMEAFRDAS